MKKTRIRAMAGEHLDLSLLDSVWKNPPPGIVLSGNTGDPLMHPEFGKLLATIRERAAESKVLLITNGQKFSYETMTEALRTCQAIRISLDADGPAMYRVTHGTKADWGQTLANVIALRFLRDEVGSDCRIGIGYLTDRRTEPGMLAATKLARELGADSIQFRPFHHRATPVDSLIEDCRQYETDDFKVLVSWQKYDAAEDYQRTYTTCQGAHFVYLLDARGDFYICCHHVGNLAARLGSLRESTWQQFIQSQTRRESIEEFNVSDCVPLCRLDSQNVVLHQLQETYPFRS
jgi:sulfatase maturation enzyme AslB (radical SAM superfamily)